MPGKSSKSPNCTTREFFAYRIQDRPNQFSLILNLSRLFQQFAVDAYTMIDNERSYYIRNQQKVLRCETFNNLRKVQHDGNTDVGTRVILPSSFTGGARYMMQNHLDAMSLCKWFGYPDLFITVTCNPKWPEIRRFLRNNKLKAEDRPDILCRMFKIKLDALIKGIKDKKLFGNVQAVVYTVEFQKRGLPHSHICIFLHVDNKMPTIDHVETIISAEIPDKNEDPELYNLVKELMIHEHTSIDSKGFPIYKRLESGYFVEKSGVKLDNRSVVAYNKTLLKRYQAHINVEWCNQAESIKYLFKYINKGPDRATFTLVDSNAEVDGEPPLDEVKQYYDCRYLSACEAAWRIFAYDVHYRTPSVVRLPFHLPGEQNVVYGVDDDIKNILNKPTVASSMFLCWMKCNESNSHARQLTYVEFPTKFVWKKSKRCWEPRKKGFSIGRIHAVPPSLGEAYYLRILLNKVKGPKSFDDILTANGHKCSSFRDACYNLGQTDDDKEYIEAIEEARISGSGYYLRSLFAMMLMLDTLLRPDFVWEKTWTYLSDGILYRQQRILKSPDLMLTEKQTMDLTLLEIEKILLRNNSTLLKFPMLTYPDDASIAAANNRLITEELQYGRESVNHEFDNFLISLTDEQRCVYDEIMKAVHEKKGGVFFVYGYGGTGKTFLWKTLSSGLRSKGHIVLNVASSGIASLLLTGGRMAHSRFLIPLNINEDSICHIKLNSNVARLLKETTLMIWDEAPMIHKHAFEVLDRSLNDILNPDGCKDSYTPFGGKVIVFGGDFRQILPVVPNGSRSDIANASLSSSYIWKRCKVLRLTKNLRLGIGSDTFDMQPVCLHNGC